MRNLAEQLIAQDTKGAKFSPQTAADVFSTSEKFRPHLANLMGTTGFRALLARALSLAKVEVAWLAELHVSAQGSLEGLDERTARLRPDEIGRGRVVLLAHLLGLLVAFVGADLTLRLVRDVWPNLALDDSNGSTGNDDEKVDNRGRA